VENALSYNAEKSVKKLLDTGVEHMTSKFNGIFFVQR